MVKCTPKLPITLVALFLMFYFFTFKMYMYLVLYFFIVLTIGVYIKPKSIKQPYFLKGERENFSIGHNEQMRTQKEVMFFIHGFPDSKENWDEQVKFFSENYHCVTIDLPWYGEKLDGLSKWGFSHEETADIIVNTLKRCLEKTGKEKVVLVAHDWGSILANLVERKAPELISKMIILDVYQENFEFSTKHEIICMVLYQNWVVFNWILSVCIPFIGEYMGDMSNLAFQFIMKNDKNQKVPPHSYERPDGKIGLTANANHQYFYYRLLWCQGLLGLKTKLGTRFPMEESKTPTLFIYAADKSQMFHEQKTQDRLAKIPGSESVAFNDIPGEEKCGHWFMYTNPVRLNKEMQRWLTK